MQQLATDYLRILRAAAKCVNKIKDKFKIGDGTVKKLKKKFTYDDVVIKRDVKCNEDGTKSNTYNK